MSEFTQTIDRRNTTSMKWDRMDRIYGVDNTKDILPMWIADMDFKAPQAVLDALQKRLDHGVFGYSYVCEGCRDAVREWFLKRHGFEPKNEWMLSHQGVVPAIASVVETLTDEGDTILITPPVYPPFASVPSLQNRVLEECMLTEQDGTYTFDLERFEEALKKDVKLFIFCNPHNPGGIVWPVDVLQEIVHLCAKYDTLILSDEIHADLVFAPNRHTPLHLAAGDEYNRVITCVAPTKTFNLAGIQAAMMIIPDETLRLRLQENGMAHGQMELNAFAGAALQAAYRHGEPWLETLLQTVSDNMDYVVDNLPANVPGVSVTKPQGTYLLWIDYRGTGLSEEEMMDKLLTKGGLALEPGTKYGEAGRGFLRMNVATCLSTVQEGVSRFIRAMA
ncbi:cystathionine beta-lyase PatB [Sporosarcina sp. NCCP-2716]|uniref:MalY/PatB family protein n=1 Tax=Sporosarcina sp. NCCP-2716 TaxID=2943679 RepID=UPI0020404F53|nr:MalY/PatB family protein [Sporosarcina sp. NCCP-2716]GKV70008.1 cystathionine beta-lyase PatB [Sporosarcina sp. NCCP-2716]